MKRGGLLRNVIFCPLDRIKGSSCTAAGELGVVVAAPVQWVWCLEILKALWLMSTNGERLGWAGLGAPGVG